MIDVIAGTTEGREVLKALAKNYRCRAFCATIKGAQQLEGISCDVHTGRLDKNGFAAEFVNTSLVIDASHPFAEEVGRNVKYACRQMNIPYIRCLREPEPYKGERVIHVSSKEEAVKLLNGCAGNIGLTTGSNTAEYYSKNIKGFEKRCVLRLMDSEKAGNVKCKKITAAPPFSVKENLEFIDAFDISVMVMKNSGANGGVPEKIEACGLRKIYALLIDPPDEDTADAFAVCRTIEELENILKGKINVSCNA